MDNFFNELKSLFQRFPGIGPRQASRFVYSLVDFSEDDRKKMGEMVVGLDQHLKRCEDCFRVFETTGKVCGFCSADSKKDKSKIMIVEKDSDLLNFEKTGMHKGTYFVLGGLFDPLEKDKMPNVRMETLKRIGAKADEIILALPSTKIGDFTVEYIKTFFPKSVKTTRLARGLSSGVELEYADENTLKHAFENRR